MKFGNRKNTEARQATVVQTQGAPDPSLKGEAENDAAEAKAAPDEPVAELSEPTSQADTKEATPAN